jgi:hypothetical protein
LLKKSQLSHSSASHDMMSRSLHMIKSRSSFKRVPSTNITKTGPTQHI